MSAFEWVPGVMPVQLLVLLAVTFLFLIVAQTLFKRIGRPLSSFWQVIWVWLLSFALLKWVLSPPIPFSLMAIYMGLITVSLFVWVSSTERPWREFTGYIFNTLIGANLKHRVLRALVVVALPVSVSAITYDYFNGPDEYPRPVELSVYHPAPPRSITVHGETIDLQTAKNPFRVK